MKKMDTKSSGSKSMGKSSGGKKISGFGAKVGSTKGKVNMEGPTCK